MGSVALPLAFAAAVRRACFEAGYIFAGPAAAAGLAVLGGCDGGVTAGRAVAGRDSRPATATCEADAPGF